MFNRRVQSRLVGQKAVTAFYDLNQQISNLTPGDVSVRAAAKYAKAIAAGVDKASENNRKQLVKISGSRNPATEQAGLKQSESRDTTTPRGKDATRDSRMVGQYAAAIGDGSSKNQSKGRYAKGENR